LSREDVHTKVYTYTTMRTNIEIDDALIRKAMALYRLRTKREAVDLALRKLVGEPMSLEEALAMRGTGWGDGLELADLRDQEPPEEW
jgi:Arc/MetJ family transcription regulator